MKATSKNLFIFFFLLMLSSCRDKLNNNIGEDGLPHGENSMYYYVDGQLVIPKTKYSGINTFYAIDYSYCSSYSNHTGWLILRNSERLRILISDLSEGRHDFQQAHWQLCRFAGGTSAYLSVEQTDPDGVVRTYPWYTRPGSGYIQFDYVSPDKKKFKGTFEMTVYHSVTGEEKHITDGHFNINLEKLHQFGVIND